MSAFGANLLQNLPDAGQKECFQMLFKHQGVCVERIVSLGQATPPDQWYDQLHTELVVLMSGEAGLQIDGEEQPRRLTAGDWVMLPARCRHRVAWTSSECATVWLAVHWPEHVTCEERG